MSSPSPLGGAGDEKRLLVQFKYAATQDDELDAEEGEMLVGRIDLNNPQWYIARSAQSGKSGLVPTTYVKEVPFDDGEQDSEDEIAQKAAASSAPKRSQRELDAHV